LHFAVNLHTKQRNMRSWAICLLINLFVCIAGQCQDRLPGFKQEKKTSVIENPGTFSGNQHLSANTLSASPPLRTSIQILPEKYYYHSIGFFCKKEVQLEKAVKLPLRVRLGSVGYTDKMEGKGQLFTPGRSSNQ